MKWFEDLPTRFKFFISFGIIIAFFIGVILIARGTISEIETSQKHIFDKDFANAADLLLLRANEDEVRLSLLMMMSSSGRGDKDKWRQEVNARAEEIGRTMQRLMERNKGEPDFIRRLEELDTARLAFKQTRESEIIPLIYDKKIEKARALALGIQSERFNKMISITTGLGKEIEENVRHDIAESGEKARQSATLFLIAGLFAVSVSFIMAVVLNRIIATPLGRLSAVAEQIGAGDLTVSLSTNDRGDEVGRLEQTFRKMVEKLRRQARDTVEAVHVLASSANEISATTVQLAASTEETAVAVAETTTTVEEVKQTVNLSSQKARQVSDIAQNAVQVSQTGARLVQETIAGISQIREQMEHIAGTIVTLSEHNQAIAEIIAAVDDLAEQSNLLAVNAAIEATRAGEQGKGFIVVAQEIKSLAEQSRQATKQVRTILSNIQKSSATAVMAIEKGSKTVDAAVKQSAGTGDSIQELSRNIAEASNAVMQIAASSQQQLVGMDQVAMAMTNIKQAATQNAAGTKQVEVTVRNLQEIGQRLKGLVEHYRV